MTNYSIKEIEELINFAYSEGWDDGRKDYDDPFSGDFLDCWSNSKSFQLMKKQTDYEKK